MRALACYLLVGLFLSGSAGGQPDNQYERHKQMRAEAQANRDVMAEAIAADHWGRFEDAARSNLDLAEAAGRDPDLLNWVTAIAVRATVNRQVIEGVVSGGMPRSVREALLQEYRVSSTPSVAEAIESERLRLLEKYAYGTDEQRKSINLLFTAYQDVLSDNVELRVSGLKRAAILTSRAKGGGPDTIDNVDLLAIDKIRIAWDQNRAQDLGVRIVLELEQYRFEHGLYPESLDELVPDVLGEVSIDPYCGEPFGYRSIDPEQDPFGRSYLLYVVGLDGKDNGGERHPDQNIEALGSNTGRGFDYVINDPDN